MRSSRKRSRARTLGAAAVALVLLVGGLVSASGASGRAAAPGKPVFGLAWLDPTPSDGKTYRVVAGETLDVDLAADGRNAPARLVASGLAAGAVLNSSVGPRPTASLTWTPSRRQIGTHVFVFAATSSSGAVVTPPRTIFVHVVPSQPAAAPNQVAPMGTNGVYRWAYLMHPTTVRARPSLTARRVTRLALFTSDDTVNLVLLIARTTDAKGTIWYRVRLPILPNGSTGWVRAVDLTQTRAVTTYLVVYQKLFTATLYRAGRPVFSTRVGVGKPYWPTPRGDFYIRNLLTGYKDPFYGPVAFGTSARSAVLTDWPGGGVVGIHGTSLPWLLPGRVSHGCVRMKNGPILRLKQLMPLGTPLAIR
jgi:L,D-transpeptidase catalytic domain